ncbi:HAD family phosphatase [bacterium]|nr:HAD family phosphatase [bacterium]
MTIKLVTTDIDGTILKHNGEFNKAVIDCIHDLDNLGVKVVLVTGRMHKSAQKIADELGLSTPIVSYQGALVKNKEHVLYEKYIPNDISKRIIDWGLKQDIHINLYMNDDLYVEKENEFTRKYASHQHIPFNIQPFNTIKLNNVNKILFIDYNDADKVTMVTDKLQKDFPELYIVKSTDFFCEVCHREATKGDGVNCIQKFYGISKEETLSIGDHNNDFELLTSGGIKIAMGNATEELKKLADYVTDTVDNDGFVKAIEKFVKAGANV